MVTVSRDVWRHTKWRSLLSPSWVIFKTKVYGEKRSLTETDNVSQWKNGFPLEMASEERIKERNFFPDVSA